MNEEWVRAFKLIDKFSVFDDREIFQKAQILALLALAKEVNQIAEKLTNSGDTK